MVSTNRRVSPIRSLFCCLVLLVLLLESLTPGTGRARIPLRAQAPAAAAAVCGGSFLATADASLSQASPAAALGGGNELIIAQSSRGEFRSLLAFDVITLLPPGAIIHSAALELQLAATPTPLPYALEVSDVSQSWSEGTVSWNTQPAQGSVYGAASYSVVNDTLRVDVTTLVRQWATTPVSTTSLMLLPRTAPEMDLRVQSREAGRAAPVGPRLVVRCAYADAPSPVDQEQPDQRQHSALLRLRSESQSPLQLQLERGALRFASFGLPLPANLPRQGLARAEWFVSSYADLLRLDNATAQLQFIRRSRDDQHIFFRQLHNGIPVLGAELGVHLERDQVTALTGHYAPAITTSATPLLTPQEAEALALALGGRGSSVKGDTQLRYVNPALFGEADTMTYLAWEVHAATAAGSFSFYLDAAQGALVLKLAHEMHDFELELDTGNHYGPYGGHWDCWDFTYDDDNWFDEDGNTDSAASAEGVQAYNNIVAVDNYWRGAFGRDSYDNDGEEIWMYVHVGNSWQNAHYAPGCDIFEFGDGTPTRDIVGHEFTHGVIRYSANLIYKNQSGALNESFADIFGYLVDDSNWLIGEGSSLASPPNAAISGCSPTSALRDISNPPCYGQPDRMSNFLVTSGDEGGVHTNSGIHNKAAFLIINGGTFNGRTVVGIGKAKAQYLFYSMLTSYLWSSAQMIDARNAAVLSAQAYVGNASYGFTAHNLCQVRNAYAAVELGQGDLDCDGTEDNVDPDTDGDGVSNGSDNCALIINGGQSDIDGDNQGDACDIDDDNDGTLDTADNCKMIANPGQADWNNDGQGDVCDDSDNDSWKDSVDNCKSTHNNNQKDSDSDGIGDVCDLDRDGDGLANGADNCADTYNPGQQDSDGDGVGDACDLCPGLSSSDNGDPDKDGLGNPCDPDNDNDGVLDAADNCPLNANADQIDMDKNGVGFACDADEQAAHKAWLQQLVSKIKFQTQKWWRMPVPICPQCGLSYLPDGMEVRINVALPTGFHARVIDSAGHVVAKGISGPGATSLSFQPAPYGSSSFYGSPGAAAPGSARVAQELGVPAASQTRYVLELYPAEGTDLSQEYELQLSIVEQLWTQLYLPQVVR